ncbi:hypothetical protein D3I60_00070 [Brevibacterium permense]|uniref:hypothetical protein n=1 Tax=Brevibacterium permense TaxID=234834 RepID=UPI0021D2F512|nr:hypothetical protein [Brevibacterium permense]MCU4295492.1 hypothetical protein [Brevibacterium permense]
MYAGSLHAARVHSEPKQKLSVYKYHPRGMTWLVVDVPAGIVVGTADSWAEALEVAALFLRAAQMPEVCS